MTLEEYRACVGARVSYWPKGAGATKREYGKITRVNDRYAFVLYDGDLASKATAPEHLTALAPETAE